MRLLGFVVLGLLTCASSSCGTDSDCGGPTSDWPHCNQDGPGSGGVPSSSDDGDGDNTSKPPKGEQGGNPATPVMALDAGVSVGRDAGKGSADSSDAAAPLDDASDAGARDGGTVDASGPDAAVTGVDGGLPCAVDAEPRTADACYGVYCQTTQDALAQTLGSTGGCRSADDLRLVCNGELSGVVVSCTQDDALMLGFGQTVAECARAEASLADASDGCIDCYVSELLCAVSRCLTPCFAGLPLECTACRSEHCGNAFQTCSGLPSP